MLTSTSTTVTQLSSPSLPFGLPYTLPQLPIPATGPRRPSLSFSCCWQGPSCQNSCCSFLRLCKALSWPSQSLGEDFNTALWFLHCHARPPPEAMAGVPRDGSANHFWHACHSFSIMGLVATLPSCALSATGERWWQRLAGLFFSIIYPI